MSKHNKEEQKQQATMETESVETAEKEAETAEEVTTTEEASDAEKIQELTEKVTALEDTKLRLMAEFENFRRRTNREKTDIREAAGEDIFRDMLPLIDDFERAIDAIEKATGEGQQETLAEGVRLIYQKFMTFLQLHNVTVIETEGKDFSTDEHEAITTIEMGEDKKDKIIDCTQKGYKLGDKVIRYAKVVVGA
ncbi:MAG: nucleotide exchange factor GrpE [Paludibacteraceae bacterium]|nr:nucleotide exchange factor GrpE [Paludibacteraceae bacterium]